VHYLFPNGGSTTNLDILSAFVVQWNSNLADWTGQNQIVRYFGVVRYFWTYVLLHKLTIFHWKLHICHLEAMKLSILRLNKHFQPNHNVLPPICSHNYTYLSTIFKKDAIFGKIWRVFTINLKFFVRYFGVFGSPNCQMSAKFGPIYFNKNWSAEKCPLNWSCPLFLESAKLEFHYVRACLYWEYLFFSCRHQGMAPAASCGVPHPPAVLASRPAGDGVERSVPDPPGTQSDQRQAKLAARHEGHRQDLAKSTARHFRRSLPLVGNIHLASTPLQIHCQPLQPRAGWTGMCVKAKLKKWIVVSDF